MLESFKTNAEDLKLGMYVSRLDRPWLETPFMLQGFQIGSDADLDYLKETCDYVFIDCKQSNATSLAGLKAYRPQAPRTETLEAKCKNRYSDKSTLLDELPAAKKAFKSLSENVNRIFRSARQGTSIDLRLIESSVEPMIESICRNPDACIWLTRMRQQDNYTYQHSIAASVWAVALGRQLGFSAQDLKSLGVGGLLFDVGKLEVDAEILQTDQKLGDAELKQIRRHVAHGVKMLTHLDVNDDVRAMVMHHHERHNGSGYPHKLAGNDIPVFARIAAVVDVFDAMTSHRSYARGVSPSRAIQALDEGRDRLFQAEIVDEFIQAVGVYPAGTLVELTTGEVAVVIAESRTRRLRPRVMVMLDAAKQPLANSRIIDLKETTIDSQGKPLNIVSSLEADAYGLSLGALAS